MIRKLKFISLLVFAVFFLTACSSGIYGTVRLVDNEGMAVKEEPAGTVVNMINTTAELGQASYSVNVDQNGKFQSEKDAITPGVWKVEASKIGYSTETATVEIKKGGSKKIDFALKKITEGKRKSIESSQSDSDKIINPGEVNIQPPSM